MATAARACTRRSNRTYLPPCPPRCSAWLPLSEAVLSMAAEHLPSPLAAAPERYARLLPARPEPLKAAVAAEGGAELAASLDAVEGVVRRCETAADAPLVLYVSKMVAVPAAALPRCAASCTPGWGPCKRTPRLPLCGELQVGAAAGIVMQPADRCSFGRLSCYSFPHFQHVHLRAHPPHRLPGEPGPAHPAEERFLAFGRVFSGVVRQGQTVQVRAALQCSALLQSPAAGHGIWKGARYAQRTWDRPTALHACSGCQVSCVMS